MSKIEKDTPEGLTPSQMGDDATKWAKEFCKRFPSVLSQVEGEEGVVQGEELEGLMVGWFANAIEVSIAAQRKRLGWKLGEPLFSDRK